MKTETTICLSGLVTGLIMMSPLNRHAKHLRWKVGIPLTGVSAVALAVLNRTPSTPPVVPEQVPPQPDHEIPLFPAQALERAMEPVVEEPREVQPIVLSKLSQSTIKDNLGKKFAYYGDVGLRFCQLPEFAEEGRFLVELYVWARHFDRPLPWKGKECLRRSGNVIAVVGELPPRIDRRLLIAAINSVTRKRLRIEIPVEPDPKFLVKAWEGRLDYVLEEGFKKERRYLVELVQTLQKIGKIDPQRVEKLTFDVLKGERDKLQSLVLKPDADTNLRIAWEDLQWVIVRELTSAWGDKVDFRPGHRSVIVDRAGRWPQPQPLTIYRPQRLAAPMPCAATPEVKEPAAPFVQSGIDYAMMRGRERLRYCTFPAFRNEAAFLGELCHWASAFNREALWQGETCVRREDNRIVIFNHPPRIDPHHLATAIKTFVKGQYQVEIAADLTEGDNPWEGRLGYLVEPGFETEHYHLQGIVSSLKWLSRQDPNALIQHEKIRLDGLQVCGDTTMRTLTLELEELGSLSIFPDDLIWILNHELFRAWGKAIAETASSTNHRLVLEAVHPAVQDDPPEQTYHLDGFKQNRSQVGNWLDIYSAHYTPEEARHLGPQWTAFIRQRTPDLAKRLQLDHSLST